MKRSAVVAAALFTITAIGCDNDNNSPTTRPFLHAAYQPTSGQNLAPGIAPYAHGDPNWPMDAGQSGGGGARR